MTEAEINELPCGIYRVFWAGGGLSVAALGRRGDGAPWLAPTNWVAPAHAGWDWAQVERMELITDQQREERRPPGPIGEGRLAEIGSQLEAAEKTASLRRLAPPETATVVAALHDLLIAHGFERKRADDAECWCDRLANDREGETAMRQAERAKTIAWLRTEERNVRPDDTTWADALGYVADVLGRVPPVAEAMPHEKTLARLRRLELALAEMIDLPDSREGDFREIARKALESA